MIWLVGKDGQLGAEISRSLEVRGLSFVETGRECDVTDYEILRKFSSRFNIDWIINCSGYTNVDGAESQQDFAFRINELGPANLANVSQALDAGIVHVSTDYVFSGLKRFPYREVDELGPTSVYGQSKLAGEVAVAEANEKHYIFRTAWLYGQFGMNFVLRMADLFQHRSEISVVDDQWGTPTWTADLSDCILSAIRARSPRYGVYHASGEGQTTWYRFALTIQNIFYRRQMIRTKIPVKPIRSSEYSTKARRPAWSVLSKDKLSLELGFRFPNWEDSLEKFIELLDREQWVI